jgi:hypothetical protein
LLGIEVRACNLNTQEAEARGSQFKASLGYMVRSSLREKEGREGEGKRGMRNGTWML